MLFENTSLLIWWIICTYITAQIFLGIYDGLKGVNEELTNRLHKRLNDIIHRVRVEKVETTYYWYDHDDNCFLGQGSTDEEIINSLKARFPDHIFYLPTNHFVSRGTDWKPKLSSIDPRQLTDKS